MATIENNGLMIYLDSEGNKNILYPITKTNLVDGLEDALNAKAPSGYGLGEMDASYVSDCNAAVKNGWYYTSGAANAPANDGEVFSYGWLHVSTRTGTMIRQDYYSSIPVPDHFVRYMVEGVWKEWEYVNPPMGLGSEYRTTERYNGKPVYVKTVNTGKMPVAGFSNRITFYPVLSNVDKIVRWNGTVTDGTIVRTLPVAVGNENVVELSAYYYNGTVYCESKVDCSACSGTATFWFTKTTD